MYRKTLVILIALAIAGSTLATAADSSAGGVVNINTADVEQLQLLPRVGPALADRIIEFRNANGPFGSAEELVAVKGIGERSLANLEPYVTTSGETTLDSKVSLPRSSDGGGSKAAG
jgi:competence protein ComEA